MQVWQALYMAFALAVATGIIALILHRWHVIQTLEETQWQSQMKELLARVR